jgi:hypothetical protein
MLPVASMGHAAIPLGVGMVIGLVDDGLTNGFINCLWLGPLLLAPSALLRNASMRAVCAVPGPAMMWGVWVWVTPAIYTDMLWLWYGSSVPLGAMTLAFFLRSIREVMLERRYVRVQMGCCDRCGYDLRASGERCPECGSTRAVAAPPPRPHVPLLTRAKNLWASRPWANVE